MDHGSGCKSRARAEAAFRPTPVDLLVIAQAPPSSPDRYFYFPDVPTQDSLFRELVRVALGAEASRSGKRELLVRLRDQGVFLIDLSLDPVTPGVDLSPFVPGLVKRVRSLTPRRIVLVKVDVYDCAFRALRGAGLPVVDERIPFPGSGQQARFREAFTRALASSVRIEHFLEPAAPPALVRVIARNADDLWRSIPAGGDGIAVCLDAVITWQRRLGEAGLPSVWLGSPAQPGEVPGGYRLTTEPEPTDHHYLAIGPDRILFDPTWRRFAWDGPPSVDRYIVAGGRTFSEWRDAARATGPLQPAQERVQPPRRPWRR